MQYINSLVYNGKKHFLKDNKSMAKIWTHQFTANEVGRSLSTDGTESVDGAVPSMLITKTSKDEVLYYANPSDSSAEYRFMTGYTDNGDGTFTYNDGLYDFTAKSSSKFYKNIFKSDFFGEEPVSFADMGIKSGVIRISYNGKKAGGKNLVKPASTMYLISSETSTSPSTVLPIRIPEQTMNSVYTRSMIFRFSLSEQSSCWDIEVSDFNQSHTSSTTSLVTNYAPVQKYLAIGSPFTDYYKDYYGSSYTYVNSQKTIKGLYIPSESMPAIGTVVEFWADIDTDYDIKK